MARLVKSSKDIKLGIALSTIFEDGTKRDRFFKVGDVVENLRYVENEEIVTVSGRITEINYTMATKITWNKNKPANTLINDMTITYLTIDASSEYNSNIVTVPALEIVEFEDEENVARMKFEPFVICDMDLYYSNYKLDHVSIEIEDTFDNVRIINPNNIGVDYTGKFTVVAFAYAVTSGKLNITGIAFKNIETEEFVVTDFKYILSLNEVYKYTIPSDEQIAEVISNLSDGDSIEINYVTNTTNNPININKENISIVMNDSIITDGSANSGVRVNNGSLTLSGNAKLVNNTPYDTDHGKGVISISENGTLTFDGSGVSAVIADDPVNKGQFGVTVYDNGKIIVNDGLFETGWSCIAGNGSKTNADSVIEINDGEFISVADYAIYHPQAGKLIVNGGIFKGAAGAIAANNGVIEINGGSFYLLGGGDTGEWADGTSGLGEACINLNAKYGDITAKITGGNFYGNTEEAILIQTGTAHNVSIEITGGKFTTKPNTEWISEGYKVTEEKDEDGFYNVIADI